MRVAVVLIVCLLGACAPSGAPSERVVRFWHFWSEPSYRRALQELIAEFERRSGCRVELTELSWNEGKAKLLAAFNSGTAPDVVELGSDWVAQFSSAGVLWELPRDSIRPERFVEFALAPAYWKGRLYAVPWVVDTRVLFYHRGLLQRAGLPDRAPRTWAELEQFAERIHAPEQGVYGCGVNGADAHRLYKKVLPLLWSFGADILDSSGMPVLETPQAVAALGQYLRLARVGLVETQRQLDALFLQGKLGLWVSGAWLAEKIRHLPTAAEYGVAPLPGVRPDTIGISFAGGEYLAITAASPVKELALQLVRFLTDGAVAARFCRTVPEAGFPAESAFIEDAQLLQIPYRRVFAQQLRSARMTPVHPRWLDIEAAFEEAVVRALYGELTAEQALREAQRRIRQLLSSSVPAAE
jgi:multiple sugar transport system substrate-binding protein